MAKKKILGILEYFNIGDLSKNKKREQKRNFFLTKKKIKARTSRSQETCRSQKLPMTFNAVLTSD